MRILAITQGKYGDRIVANIKDKAPQDWQVFTWSPPAISEPVVDEPTDYLPEKLPQVDLVLHLAEAPQAAQLLTDVVKSSGAKAVIASADNAAWIPLGLCNQLKKELEKLEVPLVFPEPLCSLDLETTGFGDKKRPYTSEIIKRFAQHFGSPRFEVNLDENNKISKIAVKRGAPCGSTEYTVKRVKGMAAEKAVPSAGLMCLHYPCLASMEFEKTDTGIDTIMHNSGKIFNEGLEMALKEQKK